MIKLTIPNTGKNVKQLSYVADGNAIVYALETTLTVSYNVKLKHHMPHQSYS